jgi:glycosyltransferase involved in cell wall biosynthesis
MARDRYSRSQVWILASRWEGFGGPVLEAMACGCAVVSTDCGGVRDIIRDGVNGFIVGAGDVEQMVERIKLLLSDSVIRRAMVKRSGETVKRFSWPRSIDMLETALRGLSEL